MAKKNWIFLKRGLSQDAKHREAIGNRIWVYLHILDRADWETGIVHDWRDKDEAEDMVRQSAYGIFKHPPVRTAKRNKT